MRSLNFLLSSFFLLFNLKFLHSACPKKCVCLSKVADCSNQGLVELPDGIESWRESLRLSGNALTSESLEKLEVLLKTMPNLVELDLSNNEISHVPVGVFQLATNLTNLSLAGNKLNVWPISSRMDRLANLDLHNNRLTRLPKRLLDQLPQLVELNLNNNELGTLAEDAFHGVGAGTLRHLDLSRNGIASATLGTFDSLVALQRLVLTRNRLQNISRELLSGLTGLVELDLSRNRLTTIESLTFKGLGQLRLLDLQRNRLTQFEDGALCCGLNSLAELRLGRNNFRSFDAAWLFGLGSIRRLQLAANRIDTLRLHGESSQHLTEIDLADNELTGQLSSSYFAGLGNLATLVLRNNRLAWFEEGAFDNLSNLTTLDLSGNKLSSLTAAPSSSKDTSVGRTPCPLSALHKLENLWLQHNHIRSVGAGCLAGNGGATLRRVSLADNPLARFDGSALKNARSLLALNVSETALVCDCKLAWLQPLVKNLASKRSTLDQSAFGLVDYTKIECMEPSRLIGRKLLQLRAELFSCDEQERFGPRLLDMAHGRKELLVDANQPLSLSVRFLLDSTDRIVSIKWTRNGERIPSQKMPSAVVRNDSIPTSDGIELTVRLQMNVSAAGWPSPDQLLQSGRRGTSQRRGGGASTGAATAAGIYQCTIQTQFGEASSSSLNVKLGKKPYFGMPPTNLEALAGQEAKLKCVAHGIPIPQISWKKDGGDNFAAARERRMYYNTQESMFYIQNLTAADAGTYKCVANNSLGEIEEDMVLEVIEPPVFVEKMPPITSNHVNQTAIFRCAVRGRPKPQISWLRNNQTIEFSSGDDRFFVTGGGSQLLVIVNVQPTDEAVYSCRVNNTLGTKRLNSRLVVLPPQSWPTSTDSTNKGVRSGSGLQTAHLIGIIVVCGVFCIALTSVVWFCVIYRSRRSGDRSRSSKGARRASRTNVYTAEQVPMANGGTTSECRNGTHSSDRLLGFDRERDGAMELIGNPLYNLDQHSQHDIYGLTRDPQHLHRSLSMQRFYQTSFMQPNVAATMADGGRSDVPSIAALGGSLRRKRSSAAGRSNNGSMPNLAERHHMRMRAMMNCPMGPAAAPRCYHHMAVHAAPVFECPCLYQANATAIYPTHGPQTAFYPHEATSSAYPPTYGPYGDDYNLRTLPLSRTFHGIPQSGGIDDEMSEPPARLHQRPEPPPRRFGHTQSYPTTSAAAYGLAPLSVDGADSLAVRPSDRCDESSDDRGPARFSLPDQDYPHRTRQNAANRSRQTNLPKTRRLEHATVAALSSADRPTSEGSSADGSSDEPRHRQPTAEVVNGTHSDDDGFDSLPSAGLLPFGRASNRSGAGRNQSWQSRRRQPLQSFTTLSSTNSEPTSKSESKRNRLVNDGSLEMGRVDSQPESGFGGSRSGTVNSKGNDVGRMSYERLLAGTSDGLHERHAQQSPSTDDDGDDRTQMRGLRPAPQTTCSCDDLLTDRCSDVAVAAGVVRPMEPVASASTDRLG